MAATECIVERSTGFTVMSNHHLRDKRLSLKSKGLLSVILSLPKDWDYTIAGLAVICDCGRDMIRAAIKELEEAGYISRTQINESGKFGGNQYVIREIPVEQSAEPLPGFPSTVNPPAGNPLPENPTELITKKSSTDESSPPISPEEPKTPRKPSRRRKAERAQPADPDAFDRFWAAYPLKVGKKKARDAFAKVKVSVDVLLAALERQKKTEAWTKDGGKYIPHPTTWLNGERWEDEVKAAPPPGGGRAAPVPQRSPDVGEVWG